MVKRPEPKGALQPVLNTIMVVFQQSQNGGNIINRFYLTQSSGQPAQADVTAVATAARTAWINNILPKQVSALSLGNVTATDLTTNTGAVSVATGSNSGGVLSSITPETMATSIVASWPASVHYRGGHFRTYFAGLAQQDIADSRHFTTTAVNNWQTAAAAFRTAMNAITSGANTYTLMGVRRYTGYTIKTPPSVFSLGVPVVKAKIRSQRRRLGKGA